jgi:lysophospholipase L1-like esterase
MPRFFSNGELSLAGFSADVLCFGDSWFLHPIANLTPELENIFRNQPILILGDSGLEVADMVDPRQRYLDMFETALRDSSGTLTHVFLSGGGNDFAGFDDFASILKADCSNETDPRDCFDKPKLQALFEQIFSGFDLLARRVAALAPNAEVRVHNYDYAIPDGRTAIGGGQWLQVPMNLARVPPTSTFERGTFRRELVANLIDTFGHWQQALADTHPHVKFKRTSGTINDNQWLDELHARAGGFKKLARAIGSPV